ncbi:hypothetical protein Sango_2755400 [Sesamum angolense]|uniref:MULE transposase domain-containing protein n=1 Tax=Sesamum angolense TaxID=2727404 RepID=A0AAE1T831_9LAMI|nr:hypothetical protein Sango_2755400 [Sesamum angolense]
MLIATTMDGNQQVLPLAFAIIDEETYASWKWFLQQLSRHVIRGRRGMCLISDRHDGLIKAIHEGPDFVSPQGVHRRLRVIKCYKTTNCGRILHTRCSYLGNKKVLSIRSRNTVTLNSPHRSLSGARIDMGSTPMLSKLSTENALAASGINLASLVLTLKKYASEDYWDDPNFQLITTLLSVFPHVLVEIKQHVFIMRWIGGKREQGKRPNN